jgi:hypothetical protein
MDDQLVDDPRESVVSAFRSSGGNPLLVPLEQLLHAKISAACAGVLTRHEAEELASGKLACGLLPELENDEQYAAFLSKTVFQNHVSWPIWSKEWLDELAHFLRSHGKLRVLEVAAGAGVLAPLMRRRGIQWRTTDASPARIGLPTEDVPQRFDALSALARYGGEVDVVFWSWWPDRDEGDALLARQCAERHLPIVFVGEPKGGCTGSEALWEQWPVTPLSSSDGADDGVLDDEGSRRHLTADVSHWPGMRDRTWVVDMSLLGPGEPVHG